MAAPTVRAVGTGDGYTEAITPGLPAGTAAGDLLLMFLETFGEAITVSGWTEAPSSPQETTANLVTRLTAFYKIAAGSDATTTSDSGDHQYGRIIGITAGTFDPDNPFNTSAGDHDDTLDQTGSVPGGTTTVADCLIVAAASRGNDSSSATFSSWTNANLTGITEQMDAGTTYGNGGGLGVITGAYAGPGSYGATTFNHVNFHSTAQISLAIAPPAAVAIPALVMAPPIAA